MSAIEVGPKPLRVSPLIKASRWSLLLLGIIYGTYHQRKFERKEAALREIELKEKPMKDAKKAEERRRQLEAEQMMIREWEGKK